MEAVLGLDIGGNHSKFTLLRKEGDTFLCDAGCVAIGLGAPKLFDVLKNLYRDVGDTKIDAIGVITSYPPGISLTYKEGLSFTIEQMLRVFPEDLIYVADFSGDLHPVTELEADDPFIFSATNFFGSGKIGTKLMEQGMVIDTGSTSTDILAIKEGKITLMGPDNQVLKRHLVGEMNWLGVLATPLSLVSRYVPFKGRMVPISQGDFYIIDVFNMLYPEKIDFISKMYGRAAPDFSRSYYNITKSINLDPSFVSQKEALTMAQYLFTKVVNRLRDSLFLLLSYHSFSIEETTFLIMGVGKDIVLNPALQTFGAKKEFILNIETFVPDPVWPFSSSLGIALHTMEFLDSIDINLSNIKFLTPKLVIK
jgi:uncharacterized hydantoinase/oxoprolinase family protein